MQSNGGVMMAAMARRKAIPDALLGTRGGTIACVAVAEDLRDEVDVSRLICIDMGGTSFDVSLVVDGEADVELQSGIGASPGAVAHGRHPHHRGGRRKCRPCGSGRPAGGPALGGCGDPAERDPEDHRRDLIEGYTTVVPPGLDVSDLDVPGNRASGNGGSGAAT